MLMGPPTVSLATSFRVGTPVHAKNAPAVPPLIRLISELLSSTTLPAFVPALMLTPATDAQADAERSNRSGPVPPVTVVRAVRLAESNPSEPDSPPVTVNAPVVPDASRVARFSQLAALLPLTPDSAAHRMVPEPSSVTCSVVAEVLPSAPNRRSLVLPAPPFELSVHVVKPAPVGDPAARP